jgi:hypothetical protein
MQYIFHYRQAGTVKNHVHITDEKRKTLSQSPLPS